MKLITDESINIPIPFAIPLLGITEPTTLSVDKARFQLLVRIIVVICAGLLFWPKVKGAFGFSTAADTEAQRKDIQERIAKIEHESGEKREPKKNFAVVTGTPDASATPTSTGNDADKAGTKRRKA